MKKVISLVTAFLLVFSLSISGFADNNKIGDKNSKPNNLIIKVLPTTFEAEKGIDIKIPVQLNKPAESIYLYYRNSGESNYRVTVMHDLAQGVYY